MGIVNNLTSIERGMIQTYVYEYLPSTLDLADFHRKSGFSREMAAELMGEMNLCNENDVDLIEWVNEEEV